MRAARTPPEPAPITNRSVSKSLIGYSKLGRSSKPGRSEVVALLLHLGAKAVHHLLGDARAPLLLHEGEGRVEHLRLLHQHLLPERRLEEGHELFELSIAEARRVLPRRLGHELAGLRAIFGAQLRAHLIEVLREL